jgi:hypothetical protein
MFDGAALGTLMIGLDSARKESDWAEAPVRTPARSGPNKSTVRIRLANALRVAADRLDRTPPALGSSGSAA